MSATTDYEAFLAAKEPRVEAAGFEPEAIHPILFPFQADLVRWACRRGRAGVFAMTGLGKTLIQAEWARQVRLRTTGAKVLLVAPLGVNLQTADLAREKLGMEIHRAREVADVDGTGVYITNYERAERFAEIAWDAIALDEASRLKDFTSATRNLFIARFTRVPLRLTLTATPAPNDVAELGNHAEFLGVLTRREMLAAFFVHDADQKGDGAWRLKGHAADTCYRWMARWASFVRAPSDLGYADDGFALPPLTIRDEIVPSNLESKDGQHGLFASVVPATLGGVGGRAKARRHTLSARLERAAALLRASTEPWVVWCGLNDEQDALEAALDAEVASVNGSLDEDAKLDRLASWLRGEKRVLLSKPSIFGHGLNLQRCNRMMFVGLGDSYEQYFQAIRRCWRFGQTRPVEVVVVLSDAEGVVADNVRRKEIEATALAAAIVEASREVRMEEVRGAASGRATYETAEVTDPKGRYRLLLGDCVERIKEIPSDSVHLAVFSPPFSSLYTYSASDRDLGNCRDDAAFFAHLDHLLDELLRVLVPGRLCCVHVQQLTNTLAVHGEISVRDFRGDVIRAFERRLLPDDIRAGWEGRPRRPGFVYQNEVCVQKNPQAQAIRTKSHALLFVQKNRDSSMSRPALADYVLLLKKPGVNPVPVKTDVTNEEWISWAHPVWFDVRESDVLDAAAGREEKDEKHLCPLQLGTIERCVRLWSNPGETVFTPFLGIGSEAYESVRLGRKAIGIELKRSYFDAACRNLRNLSMQPSLFPSTPAEIPS